MSQESATGRASVVRGFRRLGFCTAVLIVATGALSTGKIDPAQWVDLLKWLTTAYLASDGIEKAAAAVAQRRSA